MDLRCRVIRATSLVLAVVGLLSTVGGCRQSSGGPELKPPPADARAVAPTRDEHSYAEPDLVAVTHLALDLALDFAQKTLSGTATLDLDWKNPAATTLVLDSRQLRIDAIEAGDSSTWATVPFEVAPSDPILGSKL